MGFGRVFGPLPIARNGRDALPRDPPQWSDGRVRCSASDGRCTPARPGLNVSTRLSLFLRPAITRVPLVFGPFHYCASRELATPDAPETIYDQRRFTGGRYRTICGGSRGSASLPMLPVLTSP